MRPAATTLPHAMLTIVVTGRNDNYGGDFEARLCRTIEHNAGLLQAAGLAFEYLLAEWNPLPDRPLLAARVVATYPFARAVVIESAIHRAYARNAAMPFFEMPAKNAALRRARGKWILVTNGDILFDDALVARIASGALEAHTFYRAHRIDVPPGLPWPELKNPARQLASGEGRLPPPYYLGAGGDFALASRELWSRTTGFNEVIRWTTRAKDWQFFLGVAARGIPIEFIGDVYHLDHEIGFRNTAAGQRHVATAHFGGMWDFEFGLPVRNRGDWGFARCREEADATGRITTLRLAGPLFSAAEEIEDARWQEWLTPPPGEVDVASLWLLHSILFAAVERVRLIVRPQHARSAIAASSLARVAARAGVEVCCDWEWPACGWMELPRLQPEPATVNTHDLVLTERADTWSLTSAAKDEACAPFPRALAPQSPRFNPLLCRRLLRAWLRCRAAGHRRIALFGAGGHTTELLAWGLPDWLECTAILSTMGPREPLRGIPVCDAGGFDFSGVDAVMLSSVSYEGEMLETLARVAPAAPVIPLYADWPPGW